ncbi:hypothetical protein ACIHEJ_15955 [Streptomyces sp. NPDC052301]|uniref:hypothetical protein n=1 Tax=Streptomyces sp. NPDC052301 TaxID=3365687 RepID=UPI0037D2D23D
MPDRRLLRNLWTATMSGFVPLMLLQCVNDAVDDGLSWPVLGDLVLVPVVWAFLSLIAALYVYRALVHRARGTGIRVTADALEATQEFIFSPERGVRLRAALATSGRARNVVGAERLDFRWQPFRGRHAVAGSLSFDPASGEALLRVRADEDLMHTHGQRRASAFVALCQMARLAEAEKE